MSDLKVTQPCSEGCAGFTPHPTDPWSDFGRCILPESPRRGFPVRLGSECRNYTPSEPEASAREKERKPR